MAVVTRPRVHFRLEEPPDAASPFVLIVVAGAMGTLTACTCNGCPEPDDTADTEAPPADTDTDADTDTP